MANQLGHQKGAIFRVLNVPPPPTPGYRLNDGFWHSVSLKVHETSAVITIDDQNDASFRVDRNIQLRTGNRYFFGGESHAGNEADGGQARVVEGIILQRDSKGGLWGWFKAAVGGVPNQTWPLQHFNMTFK